MKFRVEVYCIIEAEDEEDDAESVIDARISDFFISEMGSDSLKIILKKTSK